MKRIAIALLAGVAAVAGLGYSASAADLAVAPAPVAVPTWTGFYIGAHVGAAWQNFSSGSIDDPNGFLASGALPGRLGPGCGWWISGRLQLAVRARLGRGCRRRFFVDLALRPTRRTGVWPERSLVAGPNASVILNANTQWLASARAKLGFTGWFNNTMLYVTGGGAWENSSTTRRLSPHRLSILQTLRRRRQKAVG